MRGSAPQKLFAKWCREAGFRDVELEPPLGTFAGEGGFKYKSAKVEVEARSDVRVRGFWGLCRSAFFEFRAFYADVSSHKCKSPAQLYKEQAKCRRREYEERIRQVEDGDFTPMIMSSSGGMGPEMVIALKHLAPFIALKRDEEYSQVMGYLRAMFTFEMTRMALICLRGSRGLQKKGQVCVANRTEDLAVAMAELRL